jgi:hypothetical protein
MAARQLASLLAHLRDDLRAQVRGWWSSGFHRLRRSPAARAPRRQLAAQALVLGLIALGLASLDARQRLTDRLPSPRDWRALTALLERDARPGDLVAILPPWLERSRMALPARLPLLATSGLDTEWLPGVRRVWLVAASGVTSLGARLPLADRSSVADAQQVGGLRVTRLDLAAPVLPLASLTERSGAVTRWREVQGAARRCLELTPGPGTPAILALPDLRLGGSLAGHVALLPPASGPAALRVRVDGGPPVTIDVTGRGGWQFFTVDTIRNAGTSHTVTIEATAPAGAALCVEALVLP